ncbi:MAG: hypothetical protein RL226_2022 [Bacteroidota bacterium]|jgi:polyisoprenoid-binding protein YceI
MKKFIFPLFSAVLLLSSCGSEPAAEQLEPCDCVEIYKGEDADKKTSCDEARKVTDFDDQFRRCMAAAITGRNPDEVNMVKEDVIELKAPVDGSYTVDVAASTIQWKGSKIMGSSHVGGISIKSGTITFAEGKMSACELVADMTSISNQDLPAEEAAKLVGHLNSPDFFDTAKHPEAKFSLKNVNSLDHKAEFTGDMTIKGITAEVIGNAVVASTGEKGSVISGTMVFDRTNFDVRFGSSKFFDLVGDKVISDEVILTFKLKANRQ